MSSRPLFAYLALAVVLAVGHVVLPTEHLRYTAWLVLLWSTAAALTAARVLHRPRSGRAWTFMALALGTLAAADTLDAAWWGASTQAGRTLVTDVAVLVSYLLLGLGVAGLAKAQGEHQRGGPALDSIIVTAALTTVLWESMVARHGAVPVSVATTISEFVVSVVASWIAAMTLRVLLAGGYRMVSGWALVVASTTVLVATVTFMIVVGELRMTLGGPIDLLWYAPVIAVAVGGLHPSMRELSRPRDTVVRADTVLQTFLPAVAVLVPPVAVLVRWQAEGVVAVVAAFASALVGCVVVVRLTGLVRAQARDGRELARHAERDAGLASLGARGLSGASLAEVMDLAQTLLVAELGPLTLDIEVARPGHTVHELTVEPGAAGAAELPGSRGLVRVTGADAEQPLGSIDFVHAVGHVLAAVITQRRAQDAIEHRALHDGLTGLVNRVCLEERLRHALDRRRDGDRFLATVFIDLDGFKAINDRYGHEVGDQVLVEVARRLTGAIRPGDTLARFAGDEFVLVLEDVDEREVAAVTDRIFAVLDDPMAVTGGTVTVSASVGLATAHADQTPDVERLLREADTAMFTAKRRGTGGAATYDGRMRMEAPTVVRDAEPREVRSR